MKLSILALLGLVTVNATGNAGDACTTNDPATCADGLTCGKKADSNICVACDSCYADDKPDDLNCMNPLADTCILKPAQDCANGETLAYNTKWMHPKSTKCIPCADCVAEPKDVDGNVWRCKPGTTTCPDVIKGDC